MKKFSHLLFALWQWTWGLPQTLLGLALLLRYRSCPRTNYHGAVLVRHNGAFGGVSLGMFLFVNGSRPEKWTADAEVHEFGHAVQSLVLGPLYLLVIGLPSAVWCSAFERYRREKAVSYYAFYPEKWANVWGAAATGMPLPTWADEVARAAAEAKENIDAPVSTDKEQETE